MTKIKICGLSRFQDIESANELMPDYIGFVFWQNSKRFISPEAARDLKKNLAQNIQVVGVFLDEQPGKILELSKNGIIDIIQLHGHEDNKFISQIRDLTGQIIIKSFKIESLNDVRLAEKSKADYIMFDSGAGTGQIFNWSLIRNFPRPYFLAGGLSPENVKAAINELMPFAVDVSSGVESDGLKDKTKMAAFIESVREGEK